MDTYKYIDLFKKNMYHLAAEIVSIIVYAWRSGTAPITVEEGHHKSSWLKLFPVSSYGTNKANSTKVNGW